MSSDAKPCFLRSSMASDGFPIEDRNYDASTAKTVPFAVVSCSSQWKWKSKHSEQISPDDLQSKVPWQPKVVQDEDFPASELNKGVVGRGWQSSRFCFFPQEIVLELQQPSRIINMQLLCHEFKIPSKVEVFVSMMNPYVHSEQAIGQMKRLGWSFSNGLQLQCIISQNGYLSLDPNDRSGHQARELKSVYVDSSAAAIRLLLYNCYTNKLNVHNQVGLMTVIITGDPLDGQQMEHFNRHDVTTPSHVSMIQVACTKGMDTRAQGPSPKAVDFDFSEVDSATGIRLRQLFQDKFMAVGNEDYDEAKRLKILIERLKELGKKLKQLERRKFAAVEVEDYDTAKLCKMEMERLQHYDEGPPEHGQIDKHKASDRLELGTVTKTPDNLQGRSSYEEIISATFSTIVKREIWTQTVEGANKAVQLSNCLEDSGNSTSCNEILDSQPAYSSFKIHQGDFHGGTIPTVLSSDKQTEFVPEILPWYRDHSFLKTSEISHASADSTPCLSSTDLQGGHSTSVPTYLMPELPLVANSSVSTSTPTSNLNESSVAPQLTPLKLRPVKSPTGLPNSIHRELTTMQTTSTGTQYYIEKQHSTYLPTVPTSPMQGGLPSTSPTTTPRRMDPNTDQNPDGLVSPTPEPRHYQDAITMLRSQEQKLPFHKGDFQSPFPTGDELVPEPLADSVKMEAGPLLSMIDLHQVECLYSKHWQLREKALQFLIDEVDAKKFMDEPVPSFRMMNKVLLRTLNDRVANVFNTSLQLLRTVVSTYASTVPYRDLHISSTGFTAILLEKLGDLNARTKEGSFETLMFLASRKEIGIHVLSGPLLKLPKNQGIWRPVLGRLQVLLHAIPLYGIQPPSRTGFSSDALMNFVIQALNSPNGEVRNAAIKVTTEVYRLVGPPVDKYLKGIKPLIREILTSNFERVSNESEQGDDNYFQEKSLSADEPGRSITRALNIGLQPLVKDHGEEHESSDIKSLEITSSFSKSEVSPNSSLSAQEQKIEDELQTPMVQAGSPSKDLRRYNPATTAKVQETGWVDSQQSASPIDETGRGEAETACESVRSHCSEDEASLDASTHPRQNADDSLMDKDENVDSCLFCGKQDARFKEGDNLDIHFCEQCPMLASCSNCGQIVEVSSLKDHYLFECASGKRYVECQKCYLAVPESRLTAHQKSKDCKMCKQHKLLRCPLCYRTVEPSDKGWRDHILQQPGCLRNPRMPIHAS